MAAVVGMLAVLMGAMEIGVAMETAVVAQMVMVTMLTAALPRDAEGAEAIRRALEHLQEFAVVQC